MQNIWTTGLNEKPLFLKENIDMVYMCPMSEKSQELVLDRLMQYKDEIAACMKDGKALFLLVGNSMELLGDYTRERMEPELQDLALFRACTQSARLRILSNTLIKAKFNDMTLIGYTSRFAHTYGIPDDMTFCKVEIGQGSNPDTINEEICKNRVIATYIHGPLLIQNPDFVHYLLEKLDAPMKEIPFEAAMRKAYDVNLLVWQA